MARLTFGSNENDIPVRHVWSVATDRECGLMVGVIIIIKSHKI